MDKKYVLYGFALALLGRSVMTEFNTADAFIHCTLFFVVGSYLIADLYLSKSVPEHVDAKELKEDVEEIKGKLTAMTLRDGFKIK